MDLNLLPLFVTVADAASMSAAAKALSLPKSSVSRGVSRLEAELGVQLFHRTTRRLSLTTAGEAFAERVRPLVGSLTTVLGSLPEQQEEPSGELRLTAPVDLGVTWLPGFLSRLLARYPKLRVDVRLSNREADLVGEGFDAALRISQRLADSSLVARRLAPLSVELYASPAYVARRGTPRAPEDLASHELVRVGGVPLPPPCPKRVPWRASTDDILLGRELLRAGLGVGVLPTFLAQGDVTSGQLVRVLPKTQWRAGALYLVHPPVVGHPSRKLIALRELLVEFLAERPLG